MELVILIYYIIICIGIIVGCLRFKKIALQFKLLTIILAVTIITEFIALYLDSFLKKANTPPYHFFQIIEYCLVAYIYKIEIQNKYVKKYIAFSIWGYPAIMLLFTIFFQELNIYPSYSLMLSYSSILVYTLISFYQFVNNEFNFFSNSFFWLNGLYFILCSVSIFTLSLSNLFKITQESNYIIYIAHLTVNYLFYFGILMLLIVTKQSSKNYNE